MALLTRRFPFVDDLPQPGPDLGEILPPLETKSLTGEDVVLTPPLEQRLALLLMQDNCTSCKEILPDTAATVAELSDTDFWILLEREPSEDSVFRVEFSDRTLIASNLFDEWRVMSVPYAFVVTADGKVEAKGELGNLGRLRESLGLKAQLSDEKPGTENEKPGIESEVGAYEHA